MSKIQIKTRIGVVTFDNPKDAAEFVAVLERGGSRRSRTSTPKPRVSSNLNKDKVAKSVRLLVAIDNAGERGLSSEKVAAEMGMKGPRGLPAVAKPLKEQLGKVGLVFDDVIRIVRSHDENRWTRTPDTRAAIDLLRKEFGVGVSDNPY